MPKCATYKTQAAGGETDRMWTAPNDRAVHKGGGGVRLKPGKIKRNRRQPKEERISFYNAERYADPTAFVALNRIKKERNRKKTYLDRGVPPFLGNTNVGVKPTREILHILGFPVFSE